MTATKNVHEELNYYHRFVCHFFVTACFVRL
jgi:hypothetical protein